MSARRVSTKFENGETINSISFLRFEIAAVVRTRLVGTLLEDSSLVHVSLARAYEAVLVYRILVPFVPYHIITTVARPRTINRNVIVPRLPVPSVLYHRKNKP